MANVQTMNGRCEGEVRAREHPRFNKGLACGFSSEATI